MPKAKTGLKDDNSYVPSKQILEKYADLLINFALNSGEGVKPNEVVEYYIPEIAKPLALPMQNAILKAGAIPMLRFVPDGLDKDYFKLANAQQLQFYPEEFMKAKSELLNHQVSIIADVDPEELKDVDPDKIMLARNSKKAYRDLLFRKEEQGNFTWTLGLWATPAKAKEVGMTLKEYWQEIIKGCYLDKKDPVQEWKDLFVRLESTRKALNDLKIEWLHVTGPDADLKIKLGPDRIFAGGSGRNIPSYELFTSPDWRGTEGWVRFNHPLYRYGNKLKDIRLEFENGVITKATAKTGQKVLDSMLKTKDADKIGEFSLTDKRISRITKPMAETLFDENMGGKYGNMHLAIGSSYHDCYRGDQSKPTKEEWAKMGYNDSAEHTDIVTTTPRTVTATLANGSKVVIYKDGEYLV